MIAVWAITLPVAAFAQAASTVHGMVVAAVDGSPVAGAVLELRSSAGGVRQVSLQTDSAGEFQGQGIVPGDYTLEVKAAGFVPQAQVIRLDPREVRYLTIRLAIQPVTSNVAVTAPAVAAIGTHSPSSTTITAERLADLPFAMRASLPDAMASSAPGMIKGHDDLVHVRGQELGLYPAINGITFWENPHTVFSASLSPEIIETANVMTGGFSAEYGNRFGGVLDVVTKSGWTMNGGGQATAGVGAAGRISGAAEYGNHTDRLAYFLSASWSTSDRFLSPPEPRAHHDSGEAAHATVQLDFNPNARHSLHMLAIGDFTNFQIPRTQQDEALRPGANASQDNSQQTIIGTWRAAGAAGSAVSTSVYHRRSRSQLSPAIHPLAAYASVDRTLGTLGVKSTYERLTRRHGIRAGGDVVLLRPSERMEYRYGGVRDLTHLLGLGHVHFAADVAVDLTRRGTAAAIFAQDVVQVTDRLTVDVGGRVDRYDLMVTKTHVSPRINAAYEAGQGTIVHASYNHLFSPPPIEGLLVSNAGLTRMIREIGASLAPLAPTVEDQVELGIAHTIAARLNVSATGYARASDNPVHSTVWPDSRLYSYASFNRARSYGIELKAELTATDERPYSGWVNYALGRAWFFGPVTGGFIADPHELEHQGKFLAPMDQTHTLTAGIRFVLPARSQVDIGLLYGSGTPVHGAAGAHEHADAEDEGHAAQNAVSESGDRVPGYFTQHLTVTVHLLPNRLDLQASVENLTNRSYALAAESVFSPSQFSIPRLFSTALRWRF